MSPARGVLAAAAALAILAGAGWYLTAGSRAAQQPGPRPAETTAAAPQAVGTPPLSDEDAARLAEQLTSGDPAQVTEAVGVPDGQPLDPALVEGLAGSTVALDPRTFAATDATTGQVRGEVTDPSGTVSAWKVLLTYTDDRWRVSATVPVDQG